MQLPTCLIISLVAKVKKIISLFIYLRSIHKNLIRNVFSMISYGGDNKLRSAISASGMVITKLYKVCTVSTKSRTKNIVTFSPNYSLYLRIRTYKIGKMLTKNSQLPDYLPVTKTMFDNI